METPCESGRAETPLSGAADLPDRLRFFDDAA